MSILGTIATAAVATLVPGAGIAIAIWKFGKNEVLGGLKRVASWLFLHPMTAVAIVACLFAAFWWQDARHWKKTDAGHVALIASVKAEVDRGVGKPTRAEDAAFYIRRFVDNVVILQGALERQNASIRQSGKDADQARADAHAAAQATPAQHDRDKVRAAIADPKRTTGLSSDEWGKL